MATHKNRKVYKGALFISTMTEQLLKTIRENPEGFTVSWSGAEQPNNGFMVAVSDIAIPQEDITSEFLSELRNSAGFLNQKTFLGGWLDKNTGLYYLDITVNINDLNEAKLLAKTFNQKAVFSLDDLEEIRIGE